MNGDCAMNDGDDRTAPLELQLVTSGVRPILGRGLNASFLSNTLPRHTDDCAFCGWCTRAERNCHCAVCAMSTDTKKVRKI
mmetsp:Transcript_7545/g.11738  ORF Transcript_7545/g.11738 Transcript_7545/m.11738 type:complete len:81 (-) Transcript_7545:22-264(-)